MCRAVPVLVHFSSPSIIGVTGPMQPVFSFLFLFFSRNFFPNRWVYCYYCPLALALRARKREHERIKLSVFYYKLYVSLLDIAARHCYFSPWHIHYKHTKFSGFVHFFVLDSPNNDFTFANALKIRIMLWMAATNFGTLSIWQFR